MTEMKKPIFRNAEDVARLGRMMLGLSVKKRQGPIPFGYKLSETDSTILEPIEEEFALLVKAKHYLPGSTFEDVATWLHKESGRYISHEGLRKIMFTRQPDDRCLLSRRERELLFKA